LEERERGTVVAIVPGGAAEALDSSENNFRLTLKNRKGFVKLGKKNLSPQKANSPDCQFPKVNFPEFSHEFMPYFVGT
jgi:hypothetical protein